MTSNPQFKTLYSPATQENSGGATVAIPELDIVPSEYEGSQTDVGNDSYSSPSSTSMKDSDPLDSDMKKLLLAIHGSREFISHIYGMEEEVEDKEEVMEFILDYFEEAALETRWTEIDVIFKIIKFDSLSNHAVYALFITTYPIEGKLNNWRPALNRAITDVGLRESEAYAERLLGHL